MRIEFQLNAFQNPNFLGSIYFPNLKHCFANLKRCLVVVVGMTWHNFHWKKIDLVVGACFGSLIVCPLQNKDDPVCPDADHAAVVDVVVFDDVVAVVGVVVDDVVAVVVGDDDVVVAVVVGDDDVVVVVVDAVVVDVV